MTKSLKSSPLPWYYSLVSIWSFHSPEIKMRKKIFHETPFQHSFSIGSYTVAPFFKSDFGNCCCCHLPFPVPLWNKQACHLLLLLTMTMAVRILTMITIIHWINWKVAPKLVNNSQGTVNKLYRLMQKKITDQNFTCLWVDYFWQSFTIIRSKLWIFFISLFLGQ